MARRLVPLLTVLAVLLPLFVPASAHAAVRSWPGRTITYWDAAREPLAVARAVQAWNATGMRIRFVRATSSRSAQLLILDRPRMTPSGCGSGRATLGYPGRGRKAIMYIAHDSTPAGQNCAWPGQALTIAHELGHVLGLGHEYRRCSVMNDSVINGTSQILCFGASGTDDPHSARLGTWRCRIVEPIDVRRVVARYGGTARAVRPNPWCLLYQRPPAPAITATTVDGLDDRIRVSLVRPRVATLAAWLRSAGFTADGVEVHATPGACATTPLGVEAELTDAVRFRTWDATPVGGTLEFEFWPLEPGTTYCVAAWSRNVLGKYGPGPSRATVTTPPSAT